jgi:hypothetical protein
VIDLEDRLTTLMRDAADRTAVRPDLRAVVDETTVVPRLIERPRWHLSPAPMLAAASVVALVVGLTAVAVSTGRHAAEPTSAPLDAAPAYRNHTDVYPLLTDVPAWAGTMEPTLVTAPTTNDSRVWALVARRGSDSLIDPIIVSTGDPRSRDLADGTPIGEVGGAPAYVFDDGDGRYAALIAGESDTGDVVVSGVADRGVVVDVLRGLTRHVSSSSSTFSIGDLPTGYDVVVEPTVQPQGVDSFGIATSSTTAADGSLSIEVVTDLSDLRFHSARQGAPVLRSIFLGGTDEQLTAWYASPTPDSVVLAWTRDPGIVLVLTATRHGITASEAIAIANDVVLTDQDTWSQTYDAAATIAAADDAG